MKNKYLIFVLIEIALLSNQFFYDDNVVVNNSLKTEDNSKICKVVSGNSSIIGSEYSCELGDGVPRTFYVLEDGDNTTLIKGTTGTAGKGEVSLIMNSNMSNETTVWNMEGTVSSGPVTANEFLKKWTIAWKNIDVSLPTYEQINNVVKANSDIMPTWLYKDNVAYSEAIGYWTSTYFYTEYVNSNPTAWCVTSSGSLTNCNITSPYNGLEKLSVRPVITLSKSLIDETITKEDTENKITISAEDTSIISSNMELKVNSIATDSETYTEIKKYITNIENIKVYDINLYENGSKIQPNGKVTLTFEVENMDINKVKVYRINDDKTYTKLESKIVDNKLQIETDHFSIYVLTEEEINTDVIIDNTNNDTNNNIDENQNNNEYEDITRNPNTGESIFYIVDVMIIIIFSIAIIYMELTGRNTYINVFQKK